MKKREQESLNQYGNIMYDRRVIRGNTYALNTLPAVSRNNQLLQNGSSKLRFLCYWY